MKRPSYIHQLAVFLLVGFISIFSAGAVFGQSTSGIVRGVIKDPSGAAIVGARVVLENHVSGYARSQSTDEEGRFSFPNVPFNPYQLTVASSGFNTYSQIVEVESSVPLVLPIAMKIGTNTVITVEAGPELVENDPIFHADIDRSLIDRLPVESPSSQLASIVTLASPGVAADSNGLMHGLGDHAENSFSVDGQPITDQQSKVFSNEVPAAAVQSIEVVDGAPPVEFGGKTSLVVKK